MTTIQLIDLLRRCKTKKEFIQVLNTHRVPVNKSKYC